MAIESEIKFTVADKTILEKVASLDSIAGFDTVDRGVSLQTDICFDTSDFLLFHNKIVFRLRIRENLSVLTFKAQGPPPKSSADIVHHRIEIENNTDVTVDDIIQGRFPDIPPVIALIERVGKINLIQSLTVNNMRHTFVLEEARKPHFELVLDDVTFVGPGGVHEVYELEIESLAGDDAGLRKIAAWLSGRYDLKPAGPSKYILGMELVGNVRQ